MYLFFFFFLSGCTLVGGALTLLRIFIFLCFIVCLAVLGKFKGENRVEDIYDILSRGGLVSLFAEPAMAGNVYSVIRSVNDKRGHDKPCESVMLYLFREQSEPL